MMVKTDRKATKKDPALKMSSDQEGKEMNN